ncbi:TRAP transporter small permease [Mesorhizobium sp. RMAD-H1]|uniref:TRAP transporter small permease n=1 Tax=Mesorhizobium sp. RMAD-H1 TaxID=2587065 RepID=UPI00161EBA75|nr:TRAP transporter small permease [Mesorhizobium sp. RMAD-H1]MBB2971645.1 TRAP-type C4-dicarboxylate transport system permease small subunit [Mesorhizobium sp. RMAD-H1]
MHRFRAILDWVTSAVCCALLSAMIVIVCWQVFSRYALNDPSTFSEELLRFGVIWLSLFGAAFATGKGTHMAVDLFKDMTIGRGRWLLEFLVPVSFCVFAAAVLIVGGSRAVVIASHQYSAVLRLPMGLVYAALPLSGVLICLYSLVNIADLFRGRSHEATSVEKAVMAGD